MRETALCDYAIGTLAALRAKGLTLSDAEVVEINSLACEVVSKGRFDERLARGRPVACGQAWLWPLTLQASDWFDAIGCDIGDGRAALAYAMAHGREDGLTLAGALQVRLWNLKLKCTESERDAAVHAVLLQSSEPDLSRPNDPEKKQGGSMTAGKLSAVMVARCGGTAEHWERCVSIDYIRTVLEVLTEQDAAEGGSVLDYQTRKAEDALDACVCRIEGRLTNGE